MTDDEISTLIARSARKMKKHWYNKASRVDANANFTDGDGSSVAEAMEDKRTFTDG